MIIIHGNIWDHHQSNSYIVCTTNGVVKDNGECVMGTGIAQQVAERYKEFPKLLGAAIRRIGSGVCIWHGYNVITFPVKDHWNEPAKLDLIEKSAIQLKEMLEKKRINVYMPKPGCGSGQLSWEEVSPIIEKHLGDLVTIVDYQ